VEPTNGLFIEKKSGYVCISLPRQIRHEHTLHIQGRIEACIDRTGSRIIVDMSSITDIYSVIVTILMRLRECVADCNGELFLVNVSQRCLQQLKLIHLDKVLTILKNKNFFVEK